jgi:hypothetical protein
MQYKSGMSESELSAYWDKPFSVNPAVGFYSWPKPEVKLRVVGKSNILFKNRML